jgi:cardiolipin synthase
MPLFSFVLFYFLGMGIRVNKKRYQKVRKRVSLLFDKTNLKKINLSNKLNSQLLLNNALEANELTYYNKIDYFIEGDKYFSSLFYDIKNATSSINIEMYIFRDDSLGNQLMDLLLLKADQGVKIKILYDPNGNLFNRHNFFKRYKHKNLLVVKQNRFFLRCRNFNYRNHKKLIIIDGRISYLGGFNIGKEYLSLDSKLSPFRDTQIRIVGEVELTKNPFGNSAIKFECVNQNFEECIIEITYVEKFNRRCMYIRYPTHDVRYILKNDDEY